MSNSEIDKLIDRIPKENKYMVTTEEIINYIYMLENRINKVIDYVDRRDLDYGSEEHEHLLNILRGEDK